MTDGIYYHRRKTASDGVISVIFYNGVYKQYSFNGSTQKLTDTG